MDIGNSNTFSLLQIVSGCNRPSPLLCVPVCSDSLLIQIIDSFSIVLLKKKVFLITGEDGNGNITAEAMIAPMSIALFVALFLLNSDRIQKAIDICSECLILLNSTDQNSKGQFDSVLLQFYSDIYTVLFSAHRHISDYISAEKYGRKLFDLYSASGIMLYKLGQGVRWEGPRRNNQNWRQKRRSILLRKPWSAPSVARGMRQG